MQELTLYEVLGVHPTATEEAVRGAYFRLARLYHPDLKRSDQKPEDTEKFIEINRAYTVLSDAAKRQAYDMELRQAEPERPAAGSIEATVEPVAAPDPGSAVSALRDAGRAYLKGATA